MLEDSTWPLALFSPVLGYFGLRLSYYFALELLGRELPFDAEMHARGRSALLGHSVRQVYAWSLAPLVRLLARLQVRPNTLTVLCFVLSSVAGLLIAFGAVTLGGVVGLLGASLDYLDGRVARMSGRATASGGFLDSTLDRWGEVAFFAGAGVLLRDSPWLLAACMLALGAGGIVSYTRAKAESLGIELQSGMMQRPERVVLFCFGACFGLAFDDLLPQDLQRRHFIFSCVLALLAALTTQTSIRRTARGFAKLRRADDRHSSDR